MTIACCHVMPYLRTNRSQHQRHPQGCGALMMTVQKGGTWPSWCLRWYWHGREAGEGRDVLAGDPERLIVRPHPRFARIGRCRKIVTNRTT